MKKSFLFLGILALMVSVSASAQTVDQSRPTTSPARASAVKVEGEKNVPASQAKQVTVAPATNATEAPAATAKPMTGSRIATQGNTNEVKTSSPTLARTTPEAATTRATAPRNPDAKASTQQENILR